MVLAAVAVVCVAPYAQAWPFHHGPVFHVRGPEIPAKGVAAGALVLLGGTSILLGRGKRNQ